MKSIHSESELEDVIEKYTGESIDKDKLTKTLEWLNDPRRGRDTMACQKHFLLAVMNGELRVGRFSGGRALSNIKSGGIYAYLDDWFIEKLKDDKLAYIDGDGKIRILADGYYKIADIMANK